MYENRNLTHLSKNVSYSIYLKKTTHISAEKANQQVTSSCKAVVLLPVFQELQKISLP